MRIRQVRPEFWSDPVMGRLPYAARLFYIGLWNVADDAGWMAWEPSAIGAVLLPYETPKRREKLMADWSGVLMDARRLVIFDCGCAAVPTLPRHQRITGKQSFHAKDKHMREHGKPTPLTDKQPPLSDSPVSGSGSGSGKERNGTLDSAPDSESPFKRGMAAAGLKKVG